MGHPLYTWKLCIGSVKAVAALIFAAALFASSTAYAGWQQTRWGMDLQHLQKVLGPQARLSHGCTGVRAWQPDDKGFFLDHYRSGKFDFSVCLNVSPIHGLSEVGLVLTSPTDSLYDDLNDTLGGKYGSPFAHSVDQTAFHSERTEWHDGDTRITLNKIVGFGRNEDPDVSIIYEPLLNADSRGL